MPKLVIVNSDGVCCEKCDKLVPEKYYMGQNKKNDELWIECIHTGWYCPNHSPTSNCDDMLCACCNEITPETIIKKMNEYVDEPLDFEYFDWDGFLNWDKMKEFDDLDEFCDWCVSTLEEDGFINWEGHLD